MMIRYRLAQSNAWVYSIKKTLPDNAPGGSRERAALVRECELELQAWIMKMDKTREFMPNVIGEAIHDHRNRQWRLSASWVSPKMLHEIGDKT